MRAEVDSLAAQVHDMETGYNTAVAAQQQFEFACAKFKQKLKLSEAVVEETITPEQGLVAMQGHMATLEVGVRDVIVMTLYWYTCMCIVNTEPWNSQSAQCTFNRMTLSVIIQTIRNNTSHQ